MGHHAANTLTIRHPPGVGYFFWAFPTDSLIPLSVSRSTNPEKTCASCGRSITCRKKWESCWNEIRCCSDACRRRKTDSTAEAFESAILARLAETPRTSSLCPSEIARAHSPDNWREHMEDIRRANSPNSPPPRPWKSSPPTSNTPAPTPNSCSPASAASNEKSQKGCWKFSRNAVKFLE